MKSNSFLFLAFALLLFSCTANNETSSSETTEGDEKPEESTNEKLIGRFDVEKDLLMVQYDCKTDVDDLHTVAAFVSLMSNPQFSDVNYHAVAGTYGVQEGLYVPPNELFQLAFGANWTDAHERIDAAAQEAKGRVKEALQAGGNIWMAEAGQSDFSAALIKAVKADLPDLATKDRFHIVQHSDWNEEVTGAEAMQFVKANATYHKIPDGNAVGNGTPGFKTPDFKDWDSKVTNSRLNEIWTLAVDLGNKYNNKEGRYNNTAVEAGGLDFSDLSETCWIFGLENIKDVAAFFEGYVE